MKTVIYDCDNTMGLPAKEIDDGLTLLYLLGREEMHLLGVTTIFGNGATDQAYAQTVKLLRKARRTDIPVWRGQDAPGEQPNQAAGFLARATAAAPGEISILASGPLTNLHAAARLDPQFFDNAREIVCMGGYLQPLRLGWRNLAELNLSADAAASYAVLQAPCPLTLMSAQVCLQAPFNWGDLRRLDFWGSEMRRTVRNWLLSFGLYCGVREFYLWDLLPAVYLSNPRMFEERQVKLTCTREDLKSGRLRYDPGEGSGKRTNLPARIRDPRAFKEHLFETWSRVRLDR